MGLPGRFNLNKVNLFPKSKKFGKIRLINSMIKANLNNSQGRKATDLRSGLTMAAGLPNKRKLSFYFG